MVEGVGSNGCEYMTGGTAVILGAVGVNFAAGMTGGMAFVYDPDDVFTLKVNPETVSWQRIDHPHWEAVLKALVEEHVAETKSPLGARLLNDWNREVERFWQVVPEGDAVAPAAAADDGRSQARVVAGRATPSGAVFMTRHRSGALPATKSPTSSSGSRSSCSA